MTKQLLILCIFLCFASCQEQEQPKMTPQHPSPMVDYTRSHDRISIDSVPDTSTRIDLSEEYHGKLYIPDKWKQEDTVDLVIHFHGDSRVAQYAIDEQSKPWILFHCHWGGGSSAYSRPIEHLDTEAFLDTIMIAVQKVLPETQVSNIHLSGWSAGYGAIRSIISDEQAISRIDGILLMDGLHCSYVPEGTVMAQGGTIDSTRMEAFLNWAKLAAIGEKIFLFTHSAVFPGTYASTTETAEYLLQKLEAKRQPLLVEGPMGMQQTSIAVKGKLQIISFAGNSAPDHVDHYYGMRAFLELMR